MAKQQPKPQDFRTWKKFFKKNNCMIEEGGPHTKVRDENGRLVTVLPRHCKQYGNGLNNAIEKQSNKAGIIVPLLILAVGFGILYGMGII